MREVYILLNEDNTFVSQWFIDGEQPEGAIKYTYTENYVKPKFDTETMQAYEGATSEEIEAHEDLIYPTYVTGVQFHTELVLSGLYNSVMDAIEDIQDAETKQLTKIKIEKASKFYRKDEFVAMVVNILELPKQYVNEFFLRASKHE